jgi:hypothetical protein
MHIERHVFGSIRGYGTLARGPGLTDADCRPLVSLSFGTPYDAAYPRSLNEKIAYWSRPLGDRRRAVTRVLPGKPDDAGRPTLLFVSCVVDVEDWDFALQGDALALLRVRELWEWNGAPELAALDIPEPTPGSWRFGDESVQRILGLVSLVEMSWRAKQPVIIRADQYSLIETATVERLLPPSIRGRYSAVYRSLSPELPATVNCLAVGVPLGSTGPSRYLAEAQSPYARELELEGFGDGHEPNILLVGYERFGEPRTITGRRPAEGPNVNLQNGGASRDKRRGAMPISFLVLVLCMLLVFFVGGAAGWLLGTTGGEKTRSVDRAWAECLLQTLELPTQTREQQTRTIEEMQKSIGTPALAGTEQQIEVSNKLLATASAVRLLKQAEDEIARVEPGDTAALRKAEQTIVLLENERIGDTKLLHDWAAARQRPKEDRYAIVMARLREKIQSDCKELESTAEEGVDPRAIEQARGLLLTLEIVKSGCLDDSEMWIESSKGKLTGLLAAWQAKLDKASKLSSESQLSEQTRQQTQLGEIASRLTELKDKMAEGRDPPHREAVGAILQALAREGQAVWGNLFGETITALAEWIINLPDPASPKLLAELQANVDECDKLAGNIETAAAQLSDRKSTRENSTIWQSIPGNARLLGMKAKKLKSLADGLAKP